MLKDKQLDGLEAKDQNVQLCFHTFSDISPPPLLYFSPCTASSHTRQDTLFQYICVSLSLQQRVMTLGGTARERPRAHIKAVSKLQTNPNPVPVGGWLVCLDACRTLCFPITELWLSYRIAPHKALGTVGTRHY